jgi:CRP-like cAMP-binding protein
MRLNAFITSHGRPLQLASGETLFRQGGRDARCFHLRSGLLKAHYQTESGKAAIKTFFVAPALVGNLRTTFESEPAPYGVVAVEDSVLSELPMPELRAAAREDLELVNDLVDVLLALAIKKEKREHDLLLLSATDRYRLLQREVPELLRRVAQHDIALYLGVTPVALSRIRGRLARKPSAPITASQ